MKRQLLISATFLLLYGCTMQQKNESISSQINKIFAGAISDNESYIKNHESIPQSVQEELLPPIDSNIDIAAPAVEKRFDINVNAVPAQSFFMSLVIDTPYNMIVHPAVDGTITLNLKNITVHEVMSTLQSVYGYEYEIVDNSFQVLPITMQTKIYKVDYLNIIRTGSSFTTVSSSQQGGEEGGEEGGDDEEEEDDE